MVLHVMIKLKSALYKYNVQQLFFYGRQKNVQQCMHGRVHMYTGTFTEAEQHEQQSPDPALTGAYYCYCD